MNNVNNMIEKLKVSEFEDYDFPLDKATPELMNLFLSVRENLSIKINEDWPPFMYFEKFAGSTRILGFRSPVSNSYLIYECTVQERHYGKRFFVSIVGIRGRESMEYLRATARLIIPFFKSIEKQLDDKDCIRCRNIVDLKTGECRLGEAIFNKPEYLKKKTSIKF